MKKLQTINLKIQWYRIKLILFTDTCKTSTDCHDKYPNSYCAYMAKKCACRSGYFSMKGILQPICQLR